MLENQDLGLSLSLGFPENKTTNPLQLNLISSLVSSTSPSPSPFNLFQKTSWIDSFPSSGLSFSSWFIISFYINFRSNYNLISFVPSFYFFRLSLLHIPKTKSFYLSSLFQFTQKLKKSGLFFGIDFHCWSE